MKEAKFREQREFIKDIYRGLAQLSSDFFSTTSSWSFGKVSSELKGSHSLSGNGQLKVKVSEICDKIFNFIKEEKL